MFKRIVLLSAITVHALSWSGMETRRLDACKAISFLSNLTSLFQPRAFNVSASASNFNKALSKSTRVYPQVGSAVPPTPVKLRDYVVGEFKQGGVVIWVTADKQHGLVASIVNLGPKTGNLPYVLNWGPSNVTTGAINNQPLPPYYTNPFPAANYSGYQNQKIIETNFNVQDYPAFNAAAEYSITINGVTYNDWFLPTLTELQQIYDQKTTVNTVSQANGGDALFVSGDQTPPGIPIYWSSCEDTKDFAMALFFYNGLQDYYLKTYQSPLAVRCVRAF